MKKTFLLTQFGSPHRWTQQYIDGVQHLADQGWEWKIFTTNPFQSKGNVEIISMTPDEYNALVQKKLGVRSTLSVTQYGTPSFHVSDIYIFTGVIFEDYLKDSAFWGITNWDVAYGRLSHFLPDSVFETTDIFSDDVNAINGVFSLWRNVHHVNNLFRLKPGWELVIGQPDCQGCLTNGKEKCRLYGADEIAMTHIVRQAEKDGIIRFSYPKYYPMLSHDRLNIHQPVPHLKREDDGSLWELMYDMHPDPTYEHDRPIIGKEIPYFHFSQTKRWPL